MKKIIMTLALCAATLSISAQEAAKDAKQKCCTTECTRGPRPMQALKKQANRIASRLGLNDATTAKFTDTYGKYCQEMMEAQKKYARIRPEKPGEGCEEAMLTDAQVRTNIENQFALSQAILDIRKKYYKEFSTFLTPKQIQRVYDMEKQGAERWRKGGLGPKGKHKADFKRNDKRKGDGPARPHKRTEERQQPNR